MLTLDSNTVTQHINQRLHNFKSFNDLNIKWIFVIYSIVFTPFFVVAGSFYALFLTIEKMEEKTKQVIIVSVCVCIYVCGRDASFSINHSVSRRFLFFVTVFRYTSFDSFTISHLNQFFVDFSFIFNRHNLQNAKMHNQLKI